MRFFGSVNPIRAAEKALSRRAWQYRKLDDHLIGTAVTAPSGRSYLIAFRDESERKTASLSFTPDAGGASGPKGAALCVQKGSGSSLVERACELLMNENYRILLGRFERDESDGEIRFSIALPYRDAPVTVGQAEWSIDVGVSALEAVMPKLEEILSRSARAGSVGGVYL